MARKEDKIETNDDDEDEARFQLELKNKRDRENNIKLERERLAKEAHDELERNNEIARIEFEEQQRQAQLDLAHRSSEYKFLITN